MLRIINEYIEDKNLPELSNTPDAELPNLLESFYSDVHNKQGERYKLQSLKCILAGLNRHFKETRNLDIISDPLFTKSNEMFKGVVKQICKMGLGSTISFPVIPDEDMIKLGDYFEQDFSGKVLVNPWKLQQAVMFMVMYFTCRRGRENLYEMTPEMYKIYTDATGKKYVAQAVDELDKNHQMDSSLCQYSQDVWDTR